MNYARFFSSFVEAGARDETLRAASASLRFGVGRPFLFSVDSVMSGTIERASGREPT